MTIGKKITNIWTVALVAVGMGVLTSGPANADIESFTYVNGADASIPTIDNSYATLELALNLGNGGAVTRDGITFTNIVHNAVSSPHTYGTWNGITVGIETGGERDIAQAEIGDAGTDPLWEWFEYAAAGSGAYDLTLTITGLQAANHYRIQILNGENRTTVNKQYNGTMTATNSTGATNAINLIYGEGGSATEYALTTLDVSNATWVNIHLDDDGGLAPGFAGIVIHSVPVDDAGGVVGVKTIELDVTGAIGDIKWQSSEDNSIWNDIVPEETGSTLDVTTLYPDTPWFRVEASTSVVTNYSTTMKVISSLQGTVILIQ